MKEKILITKTLFPDIEARLAPYFDVEVNTDGKYTVEGLKEALWDKSGVFLGGSEKIDASLIEGLPLLRAICVPAAGYNNVDTVAMTKAGIVVTNAPGLVDETVADFTFGILIAAARKIVESEHWLRDGHWKASAGTRFFGTLVHGKTLGILGMGGIGKAIARRAAGFSMPLVYHNRRPLPAGEEEAARARYVSKEELLAVSDYLVLSLPYTPANHHIIDGKALRLMKPSAFLANVGRGGLVDEEALAEALQGGRLAGAALDVFEAEPVIPPSLLKAPNLVLTPHIAGAVESAQHAMSLLAADNLIAALGYGPAAGKPPSVVNPEVVGRKRG